MALPIAPGSNPESATLTKDAWTKVAAGVNAAVIHNNFGSNTLVWYTYKTTGDTAPSGLTGVKWPFNGDKIEFADSVQARDLYLYPVGETADITVEA
jgi:hypothetical protein